MLPFLLISFWIYQFQELPLFLNETYTLPELSYGLSELEPAISGKIMDLHYNKHHLNYVKTLNALIDRVRRPSCSLEQFLGLVNDIQFNAGGHLNHSLFWSILTPPSKQILLHENSSLAIAIKKQWKDVPAFIADFNTVGLKLQGSGWIWLVLNSQGHLEIVSTTNQNVPFALSNPWSLQAASMSSIIMGIDVWEHAYYLQYENRRKDYLEAIWAVINWTAVEQRYLDAQALLS